MTDLHSDGLDFDNSSRTVVFQADEGHNPVTDLFVPIPIFDDDVDESEQYFIVQIMVASAVSRNLITLRREASRCRIIDNDRECLHDYTTLGPEGVWYTESSSMDDILMIYMSTT